MGALFSWVNAIDSAILAAGAQVTTLPVGNLKDSRVKKVWRSGTSTSTYFTADFGAATDIGLIGLFGCTLSSTDTVRIRLSNVALGNSELLDTTATASGVASRYGQYVYICAVTISARYMRIDIDAASRATPGYFDVGRAWAGPVWRPAINFDLGWGEQWNDDSEVVKNKRSNSAFVDPYPRYRTIELGFSYFNETDRTQALNMDYDAGRSGQIVFVHDETGRLATGPLLGRMTAANALKQNMLTDPVAYAHNYILEQDG